MDIGTDNGRAIGRVERQNEDIVAIGRIGRRWIMRRYEHAVGMDVGWIKRQERFVCILRVARVGDRRQLVHEMDFERISRRELQTRTAIKIWRAGFGWAIIRSVMGV